MEILEKLVEIYAIFLALSGKSSIGEELLNLVWSLVWS